MAFEDLSDEEPRVRSVTSSDYHRAPVRLSISRHEAYELERLVIAHNVRRTEVGVPPLGELEFLFTHLRSGGS